MVIPVATQRHVCTALLCRSPWVSTVAVLGPRCRSRLVQRQVLVQTVQKTVGVVGVTVIILLVPAVQSYVSRATQSDRVPDIPVMLTVQFLNKVVDMVVCDSCPWFGSAEQLRSSTISSTSLVQNSGSASDPVIDRAQ